MVAQAPQSSPVAVRLRNEHRDITLETGTYLVGRHRTCDVVLDAPHISRRHLRLNVSRNGVHVADVASANGVYVNGERIGVEPVRLVNGDRLLIGEEELEIVLEAPARPLSDKVPVSRPAWFIKPNDDEDDPAAPERSSPGTRTSNFFELIGKIVDRALVEGRLEDAGTMLQSQLNRVLADARAGREIDDAARDGAIHYALLLGQASRNGRWLDYALDLLSALRFAPSGRLAAELESAISAADFVDEGRLSSYIAALESTEDRLRALKLGHWARGLRALIARKSSR
jgi:pSer/pThr/pTyr-binding forkhead associated (FHA) protein